MPSKAIEKRRITVRLASGKLAAAQRILGTTTAKETVEMALDMIVFRTERVRGTRALLGIRIDRRKCLQPLS